MTGLWRGETVDAGRRAPRVERRQAAPAARPGSRHLLRRLVAGRAGRSPPARRRLPDLGRAAGRRWPRSSRWMRELAAAGGPRRCASASGCTSSPATPPRRRGRRPAGCSSGIDASTIAQRPGGPAPAASPRASAACSSCTAASTATTWRSRPNLWAGVGLVRGGAGTALVGSHAEVADRIEEYAALGIDRVHPLRLPAPRGGVLVRRGRAARSSPSAACWRHPAPAADAPQTISPFAPTHVRESPAAAS